MSLSADNASQKTLHTHKLIWTKISDVVYGTSWSRSPTPRAPTTTDTPTVGTRHVVSPHCFATSFRHIVSSFSFSPRCTLSFLFEPCVMLCCYSADGTQLMAIIWCSVYLFLRDSCMTNSFHSPCHTVFTKEHLCRDTGSSYIRPG